MLTHILRDGRIFLRAAQNQQMAGCDERTVSWKALS
jgi:hypothetical protein